MTHYYPTPEVEDKITRLRVFGDFESNSAAIVTAIGNALYIREKQKEGYSFFITKGNEIQELKF